MGLVSGVSKVAAHKHPLAENALESPANTGSQPRVFSTVAPWILYFRNRDIRRLFPEIDSSP
jgi:hypothetical protein